MEERYEKFDKTQRYEACNNQRHKDIIRFQNKIFQIMF